MLRTHAVLRSRGQTRPALPVPAHSPDPAALRAELSAAHRAAADCLGAVAGTGVRVAAGLAALQAAEALLAGDADRVPFPNELEDAELKGGAKALDEPPCEAYREAWAVYRQACADHHARAALALIGDLLERFAAAYAQAKAARAGLDFEDLELGVRDLLASGEDDPHALVGALRADHGRRVPGHQPAPARRPRGARARQPVRGRRRVPVDLRLPPRRRHDLPRAPRGARRGARAPADGELPLLRGAARRPQRRLRAAVGAELRAAGGRSWREGGRRGRDDAAALRPRHRGLRGGPRAAARGAAGHRPARLGRPGGRGQARPRRPRRAALATGRGAARRPAPARGDRRRAPPWGRRRAGAGDRVAAPVRAGARGAGPADLRGRRSRLLVGRAGARRPRLPVGARQPAGRGGAARRARVAAVRRRRRRAGAARRGGARERRRLERAVRRARSARRRLIGRVRALARVPGVLRRRTRPRRARRRRGPARTGDRRDGLRRGRARPGGRRAPPGQPAQAHAPGARVRARRGARPARLPRLRRDPGPDGGARGRGAARVRGPRRRAADDDPPRQGSRVPRRVRARPRPPGE